MLGDFLSHVQTWAAGLGGVGLLVIATLDSSFLSFPQVPDLLIIVLSTAYPDRMPYYAGMTTLGSLVGCFILYSAARRGGEVFMRKRFKAHHVDKALALYQRFGLLAVIVPALLPPPMPFKAFVLLAGVADVSPLKFSLAILIGRGVRYFGQGYLAVLYGERAIDLIRAHGTEAGIALAAFALTAGIVYYVIRRQLQTTA